MKGATLMLRKMLYAVLLVAAAIAVFFVGGKASGVYADPPQFPGVSLACPSGYQPDLAPGMVTRDAAGYARYLFCVNESNGQLLLQPDSINALSALEVGGSPVSMELIAATEDFTDQSASIGDTTMYTTPGTAGFYRAEYATFLVDNNSATLVVNPIVAYYQHGIRLELQLAGFNETGVGSFNNSGVGVFWADPSTVIQYAANTTGFVNGSGNFFDLHITLEKVR